MKKHASTSGPIEMFNEANELFIYLSWGDSPDDLDFHAFTFNERKEQIEHIYFEEKYSSESDMTLNRDDIDSYGPERIRILNLDPRKYYLLSVHNYSLMLSNSNKTSTNESSRGKLKLKIVFYGETLTIESVLDGDPKKHWLDGFIIHDRKFYVLNSFVREMRSRHPSYDFNKNEYDREQLFKKMDECTTIYEFDRFKDRSLDI